jgi:hypothetical protein
VDFLDLRGHFPLRLACLDLQAIDAAEVDSLHQLDEALAFVR